MKTSRSQAVASLAMISLAAAVTLCRHGGPEAEIAAAWCGADAGPGIGHGLSCLVLTVTLLSAILSRLGVPLSGRSQRPGAAHAR
jgi:hypothetical protein